jgi:hypothetical protein
MAIRVQGEDDLTANLAPLTKEIVISGFEISAEEFGGDKHVLLGSHVVSDIQDVNAKLDKLFAHLEVILHQLIHQLVDEILVIVEIHHEPAHTAQHLGAFKYGAGDASYREIHERTGILGSIGSYATFFRNRIYTGTLVYSGEEYKEFVPRLIPDEWFERGQPKRRKRFQHTPRHHASDYLLSGLLHCGHCGGAMGGDSIPARADAGDGYQRRRYRRYVCLRWKSRRDCDGDVHYVTANALEAAVLDKLVEEILRPERLLRVLKDAQPDEETRQSLERERHRLEARIADTETVIQRLLDAVERSGYSPSLEARLGQREQERTELETELSAARRRLAQTETEVPLDLVEDFCYHAREVLDTGNVEDVRALLRTFIVRIEVEDHWGRIIYGFP